MTRGTVSVAVVLAAALAGAPAAWQQNPPQFRSSVERVRLDVMVTDRGKPTPGLTAEHFQVKDNGRIVTGVEVEPIDEAVGVAIALDLGRSARPEGLTELIAACEALGSALEPRDQAWLLTFSSTFALKVGPTNDASALRRALEGVTQERGSAMWDTLFGGVSLAAGRPGRALVLLFTDGVDRASWMSERKALDILRRADVVVSGIRPPGVLYGFKALEAAANATGGRVLYAQRGVKLDAQFSELLREFRTGYVLSYPPAPASRDGWHEVDVKLKGRRGTVRVRDGYYEPGR